MVCFLVLSQLSNGSQEQELFDFLEEQKELFCNQEIETYLEEKT